MEVDGRFEVYPYYDDLGGQTLRLVAGQKEWKVEYLPGIDSGARITSIQWQIVAKEDSDDNYKYIIEANVGREENWNASVANFITEMLRTINHEESKIFIIGGICDNVRKLPERSGGTGVGQQ